MIEFKPVTLKDKPAHKHYMQNNKERGCEFSFTNLFLWGQQNTAVLHDHMILFSRFYREDIYPYPIGAGDNIKLVLDTIIADAAERKIPCMITSLRESDKELLEELYPGSFSFSCDRSNYDYVYSIDDLADLKGRKYHRKRNHLKRFQTSYPEYTLCPLDKDILPKVREMIDNWYKTRPEDSSDDDFLLEQAAINKALDCYSELELDGLAILYGDDILAVTIGSRLSADTFDVHFEKATPEAEGAYAAINYEFARYIRNKYPQIQYLNREDDVGLEGLRKAKESYFPHHMIEKYHAVFTGGKNEN